MKHRVLTFAFLLLGTLAFVSCKKDNPEYGVSRPYMTGPSGVTVNYTTMDQLLNRLSNFTTAVK